MGKLAFSSDVRLFFGKRQPLVLPPLFCGRRSQLFSFCRLSVPRYVSRTHYHDSTPTLLTSADTAPTQLVVFPLASFRVEKERPKHPFFLGKLRHMITSFHCVISCLQGLSDLPRPIGLASAQQKKRQTQIGLSLCSIRSSCYKVFFK